MRSAGRLSSRFRTDFNKPAVAHFYLTFCDSPDIRRLASPRVIRGTKQCNQTMAGSIRVSLPDNESTAGADEDSCGSPGGSPARPRPQKRRRIPVACGACRSKKSRVSNSGPQVGRPPSPSGKVGGRWREGGLALESPSLSSGIVLWLSGRLLLTSLGRSVMALGRNARVVKRSMLNVSTLRRR